MAKGRTANPALDGTVDVPPAPPKVRLVVRTVAALGNERRYRAGLGPFGRTPVTVEATDIQAGMLRADPWLDVRDA